jgi:hypothetical protein
MTPSPDQIAAEQWQGGPPGEVLRPKFEVLGLLELRERFPSLRPAVIHGLLREGETANMIAAPKVGKSWAAHDLAIAVATGQAWMGQYPCVQGYPLLLDYELHPEVLSQRFGLVADARGCSREDQKRIRAVPLRGVSLNVQELRQVLEGTRHPKPSLVIIDALYRALPANTSENDNAEMSSVYNTIDSLARTFEVAVVVVHHSSKGVQAGRSVTDVGSGAGAISRAVDTHIVLRHHQEADTVVFDAVARSWPAPQPVCFRWGFPLWHPAPDLNPEDLRESSKGTAGKKEAVASAEVFAKNFATATPESRATILRRATEKGLTEYRATQFFGEAQAQNFLFNHSKAKNKPGMYATVPPEFGLPPPCAKGADL